MSIRSIDELIWAAFTDAGFRGRLLDGHRQEIVETSSLTELEKQTVLAIQADTLEAFAWELCQQPVSI